MFIPHFVQPAFPSLPPGGWPFIQLFEDELEERQREQETREKRLVETQQIDNQVDRDIALLFREKEAESDRQDEITRLAELVRANADLDRAKSQGERVQKAFNRAVEQGNFSALEALERELKRVQEEEMFFVMAILLLAEPC